MMPHMEIYWEVMNDAIASVLDGSTIAQDALARAEVRIEELVSGFRDGNGRGIS